jgi:hypothetical protein
MQAKNAARNAKTRCAVEMGANKSRRVLGGETLMVTGHHFHTYRLPCSFFVLQTGVCDVLDVFERNGETGRGKIVE